MWMDMNANPLILDGDACKSFIISRVYFRKGRTAQKGTVLKLFLPIVENMNSDLVLATPSGN